MPALPNFNVEKSVEAGAVRIVVSGELDLSTAASFEALLVSTKDQHLRASLDLSALEFVDATGLRALEHALEISQRCGWLQLDPHMQPQVRRVLQLSPSLRHAA